MKKNLFIILGISLSLWLNDFAKLSRVHTMLYVGEYAIIHNAPSSVDYYAIEPRSFHDNIISINTVHYPVSKSVYFDEYFISNTIGSEYSPRAPPYII